MDEAVWLDESTDATVLDLSFAAPGGDGMGEAAMEEMEGMKRRPW
jgi:hypothetical protein